MLIASTNFTGPTAVGDQFVKKKINKNRWINKYKNKNALIFQGECRQLSFPASFTFGNTRLLKHIIGTIKVLNFDLCELQCYHEPNCVSINFKDIPDSEGFHECELNNATHRGHDNDLMKRDGFVYKGAEVRYMSLFSILFFFSLLSLKG